MKKFFKIFGIVFLCIALAVGGVALWQKDHIKALITGVKYSKEELGEMMVSAQDELKKAVESFSGEELREYTPEELEQIENGEISSDEVMAKIINEALEKKLGTTNSNQGASNRSTGNNAEKTADIIINEHIAQLYAIKSSYMGQIDSLIAQGAAEYSELVKAGNASSAKQTLLPRYISAATSLESACDNEVEQVISSLSAELKKKNHSLDIIKTIRSAYANEKSIKIAQIVNKYGSKIG